MDAQNGEWEDVGMSCVRANLLALPLVAVSLAGVLGPYHWLWGMPSLFAIATPATLLVILAGAIAYEYLHAAGWVLAGVPKARVRFGVHWKIVTPYARCTDPVPARAYRIGVLLPGVVLGLVPAVAGVAAAEPVAAAFGAFFLSAATGDLLVLWSIRRVGAAALVRGHPRAVGCLVARS